MSPTIYPPAPPIETIDMFSYIENIHTRQMIFNGYLAIERLELWNALDHHPIGQQYPHEFLNKIVEKMEKLPYPPGHSGSSLYLIMSHLVYIAKNGIDKHKQFIAGNT